MALTLTSTAFADNEKIPAKYTCDGERFLAPPLAISGIPAGTKSLALIMDDPDIPTVVKEARGIEELNHWVLYNIPATATEIPEGGAVEGDTGINGIGTAMYIGPCPPPEHEPSEHRYIFTLYALSGTVSFATPPAKAELVAAITPLVIEQATLTGRYSRK